MPTDLTTVHDHPAAVLTRRAETLTSWDGQRAGLLAGAVHLNAYQEKYGVTFAALDNDALEAVRDAYSRFHDREASYSRQMTALDDLLPAINALLGLDGE